MWSARPRLAGRVALGRGRGGGGGTVLLFGLPVLSGLAVRRRGVGGFPVSLGRCRVILPCSGGEGQNRGQVCVATGERCASDLRPAVLRYRRLAHGVDGAGALFLYQSVRPRINRPSPNHRGASAVEVLGDGQR